ncbi:MAG: GNAT family N-acetyltransferase [Arenicella sp.]
MNIEVKPFSDTVQEVNLINQGERESFEVNIPSAVLDPSFSKNRYKYLMRSDKRIFFLLIDDFPAGYIVYRVSANRQPKYGHIISIYISKNFRGNHFSDILIKFVLDDLSKHNIDVLRLEVTANNQSAIQSYKRNGFKVARLEMEFIKSDDS